MSLTRWLRNLDSRRARQGKRNLGRRRSHGATHRLNFEPLEDRHLLAFLAPVDYAVGTNPQSLLAADFNNDNVQDLAVADFSDNTVSVLLGSGDGAFQPALDSATGMYPHSLAVGDFNGDGTMDLATGHPYSDADPYETGEIHVLLGIEDADGNGTGTFAPPARLGFAGAYPPVDSLAVGDFNGDGLLDLGATANDYAGWLVVNGYYWYGSVRALLGNGDGSFSALPPINITGRDGGMDPGVVATEVNGDSFDDLVTVSWNADGSTAVTLVLGSSGGLSHSRYQVFSTPSQAYLSVAAGDLDADDDIDLVVTDRLLHSVSVLLGDGAGSFTEVGSYATGSYPFSVVLGDFTGDGSVDIATGGSMLYGGGDGTFSSPVSILVANGVTADFNGDGWLDAAAIVYWGGRVSVMINDQSWQSSPPPSMSISDRSVTEGNSGTANATFTVNLSNASTEDVTVHYATADVTATAGSDYVSASGTLIIPAGQTSKTFTIAVKGDRLPEPTETFAVNLSAATNATIGDGQAIGTILDNEPRVSISDVSKSEGKNGKTTLFTFTVTLSAAYDQAVTMSYRTVNGTATTGNSDYIAKTGTLTFAPGETSKTITIEVKGDSKKESNETFYLDLFGLSSNALFTKNRGIGTILNDD